MSRAGLEQIGEPVFDGFRRAADDTGELREVVLAERARGHAGGSTKVDEHQHVLAEQRIPRGLPFEPDGPSVGQRVRGERQPKVRWCELADVDAASVRKRAEVSLGHRRLPAFERRHLAPGQAGCTSELPPRLSECAAELSQPLADVAIGRVFCLPPHSAVKIGQWPITLKVFLVTNDVINSAAEAPIRTAGKTWDHGPARERGPVEGFVAKHATQKKQKKTKKKLKKDVRGELDRVLLRVEDEASDQLEAILSGAREDAAETAVAMRGLHAMVQSDMNEALLEVSNGCVQLREGLAEFNDARAAAETSAHECDARERERLEQADRRSQEIAADLDGLVTQLRAHAEARIDDVYHPRGRARGHVRTSTRTGPTRGHRADDRVATTGR